LEPPFHDPNGRAVVLGCALLPPRFALPTDSYQSAARSQAALRRNSSGCRSLLAEYLGPQRRLFPRGLEIPTERIADTGRRGVFVGLALCDTARGAVREVPLLQQYAKPENPQRKTISMTALFLFLATFSFSSESGIYGKSVLGTEPGTVQVGEGLGAKNQDFCDETRNQGRLRLHGPIPCF